MNVTLFETEDGSHSIFVPDLNERYHSFHGAISESKHIYIQNGLDFFSPSTEKINVLEIGFGTGLNAYLTLLNGFEKNQKINYTSLEPFPLPEKIYQQLNYPKILGKSESEKNIFSTLHSCDWNISQNITSYFSLLKIQKTLQEFESNQKYNLIYFDAFAPEIQPFMWTKEVFEKLFFWMENSAILLTYCAKGIVKRRLKEIGFTIENLPGPTGKREIIRATKIV